MRDGRKYRFDIARTSIARSGPLTALVIQEGNLVASDGGPWLEATVTLQFHAGLGAVRVEVSCTNPAGGAPPGGHLGPGRSRLRLYSRSIRHDACRTQRRRGYGFSRSRPANDHRGRPVRGLPGFERRCQLAVGQPRQPRWPGPDIVSGIPRLWEDGEVSGCERLLLRHWTSGESRITIADSLLLGSFPESPGAQPRGVLLSAFSRDSSLIRTNYRAASGRRLRLSWPSATTRCRTSPSRGRAHR